MFTLHGEMGNSDITIVVNWFAGVCWLVGVAVPFVVFFCFGFMARKEKMSAGYKLAVAWGLGLFTLPLALLGSCIYVAITGTDLQIPDGPAVALNGVINGTFLLTSVVVWQAGKLSIQHDEEERLRKEADASMATSK